MRRFYSRQRILARRVITAAPVSTAPLICRLSPEEPDLGFVSSRSRISAFGTLKDVWASWYDPVWTFGHHQPSPVTRFTTWMRNCQVGQVALYPCLADTAMRSTMYEYGYTTAMSLPLITIHIRSNKNLDSRHFPFGVVCMHLYIPPAFSFLQLSSFPQIFPTAATLTSPESQRPASMSPSPGDCADDAFGPWAGPACRGGFDFTLLFEESILTIPVQTALLLVVPWRLSRLLRSQRKTRGNWLLAPKLVRISAGAH